MVFQLKLLRGGHTNEFCESLGGYQPGETFHERVNLAEREPNRFALVGEVDEPTPPSGNGDANPEPSGDAVDEGLEELTVAQLKSIAHAEGVELDGTERKAEIINAIRLQREVA